MEEKEILFPSEDKTITTSRLLQAELATVYKAWTDANHLKNWWGPNGFSNTFHTYELKPGGQWIFTMHSPEGSNYENECLFIKIIPNKELIWNHISAPKFQVQTRFNKEQNGTRVAFCMVFETAEECSKLKNFILEKNEENMDRLENELHKMI
jgi:uncharacterized protein YndB with AHSA1/START domain